MTPWQLVAIVVDIAAWLAAPPVTLADAARREAIRREIVGASVASYSNLTLSTVPLSIDPPRREVTHPPPAESDEAVWRERVGRLNDAIRRDEAEIVASEGTLAWLQSEASARDDPAAQVLLRQQVVETLDMLVELRRRVDEGRRALDILREDARRLNIPPGWLRP